MCTLCFVTRLSQRQAMLFILTRNVLQNITGNGINRKRDLLLSLPNVLPR